VTFWVALDLPPDAEKSGSRDIRILVSNQGTIIKVFYLSIFGYQNINCVYFCIVMTQAKYMKKIDFFNGCFQKRLLGDYF
jgi:hypothetical protein